jgi:hypothetical protein
MVKRIFYILFLVLLHANLLCYSQQVDTNDSSAFTTTSLESASEYDEGSEPDTSTLRSISESKWQKIKEDKAFVYKRDKAKKEKPKKVDKEKKKPIFDISLLFNSRVFKIILFLLLGITLIFVIYHLFLSGEFNFMNYRKKKPTQSEPSYEQVEEFSAWDQALNDALSKQDYRLAVRILYLETLQKLNTNGLINYQQDKTNWEYVIYLSTHTHGQSFKTLTKYFDYIWYGSFMVDQDQYKSIETSFRTFQQAIR